MHGKNDADAFMRVGGVVPVETDRRGEVAKGKQDYSKKAGRRGDKEIGVKKEVADKEGYCERGQLDE